ncbi:MAG: PEP-CTERM sorting domain-containing protein [Gammaproteobacteria bacterium]|nr:PEP-CTERM sorting domain-containing protein [Gammaproteobacteria bacterium]
MTKTTLLVRILGLLLLFSSPFASALPYNSLYVFGDSLSDNGNAYLLTGGLIPPSPPYAQRFSNGPVAVEHLAAAFGIGLAPSLAGGTNYAVGGAATGTASFIPPLNGTGISTQIGTFTAAPPVFDPARSLFVVWGGPNDFFLNPTTASIAPAVTNLANAITALAAIGAEHILVPNMPDLGTTPFGLSLGTAGSAGLTALSLGFNEGLAQMLGTLDTALAADIIPFDIFSLLAEVRLNSSAYGFSNVSEQCLGNPACTDPDTFLFWDGVHPTARGHAILGARFAAAVPEPASVVLLLAGLTGIFMLRRRTEKIPA